MNDLSAARPVELQQRLVVLKREIEGRFLESGQLLLEAYRGNYHAILGYATFEHFVHETLDLSYRTAKYLMDVYAVLIEQAKAPVAAVAEVGWSRAKELVPVVTRENAAEWLDYAKTHKTTDINRRVRQAKSGGQAEGWSPLTFGLFDGERKTVEEALELAARETGNERNGYNLALICADYAAEARARQEQATAPVLGGQNG
jgi:hypothetical protein